MIFIRNIASRGREPFCFVAFSTITRYALACAPGQATLFLCLIKSGMSWNYWIDACYSIQESFILFQWLLLFFFCRICFSKVQFSNCVG